MAKLPLPPAQAGYTQTPGSEFASVMLEGGRSWRRKTKEDASSTVAATWILTKGEYNFFWAFFRAITQRGSLGFEMDLVLEDESLQDVTCYWVQEPVLIEKNAEVYTVQGQLEVVRPAYDPDLDAGFVNAWLAYGPDYIDVLNRLEIFANEDMPEYIGA